MVKRIWNPTPEQREAKRVKARLRDRVAVKNCLHCGTAFKQANQKICSPKCHILYRMEVSPATGCWLWKAGVDPAGYGRTGIGSKLAHRMSYIAFVGEVPDGLDVLHSCSGLYPRGDHTNRRCVNPEHLHVGTHQENMREMVEEGRTHVPRYAAPILHTPEEMAASARHWTAGENAPRGKLTAADVIAIRASREPYAVLCKRYNVEKSTISCVRLRRSWKHIPPQPSDFHYVSDFRVSPRRDGDPDGDSHEPCKGGGD